MRLERCRGAEVARGRESGEGNPKEFLFSFDAPCGRSLKPTYALLGEVIGEGDHGAEPRDFSACQVLAVGLEGGAASIGS
jgi:hypothetical protein